MKIKKGDNVIVLSGKDKGKKGKVLKAIPHDEKVIVEGVSIVKKHQRATTQGGKGETIEKTMPIHVSNVALLDGDKPTRVGYKIEEGKKIRISKRSGKAV
ncbi:MAG: large subunit ribosomal protein L24 [Candidatus Paceibacteria bacterium]|jgi:large subunit ribosomal protein L24